ncbi:hypothetical protein [uncultured Roseibium sp.]|uniref:hypothetical protein n=1 Tax=uncultured Roseibium sp. TaxID=1936171 RepID=UPI0026336FAD|nr:hypothetical protein [uncultured Roseibium sp.]
MRAKVVKPLSSTAKNPLLRIESHQMKRARQITLQDRLSAMFRILPGVAAAAMMFSLVYFSPLFDMKDSIAAAADSHGDRGSRSDRGGRSERGDRDGDSGSKSSGGDSGSSGGDSSGGSSSGGGDTGGSRSGGGDSTGNSSSGKSTTSNSSAGNKSAGRSSESRGNSGRSGGSSSPSSSRSSSGGSSSGSSSSGGSSERTSFSSATQKSGSGGFLDRIFGGRQFNGDSEPSGGSLSAREEREAISNGWQ